MSSRLTRRGRIVAGVAAAGALVAYGLAQPDARGPLAVPGPVVARVEVPPLPAVTTAAVRAGALDPRELPRCAEEDGPGPCFWDAGTEGNGVGHSFWISSDACMHYLAPRDAARWDTTPPCEDPYEGEH